MKRMIVPVLGALAFAFATAVAQAQTSGYTQYSSSFTVQNRTSGCGSFHSANGVYTCSVCAGEQRTEMRWKGWPQQTHYNQWQGTVSFTSGTQKTCIMQIKSNTGGEPIYIQVASPGTLRNDGGSVFATGMANTWFRLNSLYNPVNGDGRAYINGAQKVTRTMKSSSRDWYFKNGTYNNGLPSGGKSTAYFKNITHWVK